MLPNLLVPSSPRDSFHVSVQDDDFKVSQFEEDHRYSAADKQRRISNKLVLLAEGTQVASTAQLVFYGDLNPSSCVSARQILDSY